MNKKERCFFVLLSSPVRRSVFGHNRWQGGRIIQQRGKATDPMLELQRGVASMLNDTAERLGFGYRISVDNATKGIDATNETDENLLRRKEERSSSHQSVKSKKIKRTKLNSSLRYMAQEDIERYAERLVGSGNLGELEGLPRQHTAAIERFVYTHCVKILLCLLHEAIDRLEGAAIWGDICISRVDHRARAKVDLLGSLEYRLSSANQRVLVDVRVISKFVDNVIRVQGEKAATSKNRISLETRFERLLHYNVSNIVLNLIADVCATYQFDFFGHSLQLQLKPNDFLNSIDLSTLRAHRDRRGHRLLFDDGIINALTEEILADKNINLWLIPDSLERTFYHRFFSFYGVLLDYALSDLRLSVLDVQAQLHLERRDHSPREDEIYHDKEKDFTNTVKS